MQWAQNHPILIQVYHQALMQLVNLCDVVQSEISLLKCTFIHKWAGGDVGPSLHCRRASLLLIIHAAVFLLVTVSVCKKPKTDLGAVCFLQISPSVVAPSQKQSCLFSFQRCKDWLWVSFFLSLFLCMQTRSFFH